MNQKPAIPFQVINWSTIQATQHLGCERDCTLANATVRWFASKNS